MPELLGIPEEKTQEPEKLTPEDLRASNSPLPKSKKSHKKNSPKKTKGSSTSIKKKAKKEKKMPYLTCNLPKSQIGTSLIQSNRSIKEGLLQYVIPEISTVTGSGISVAVSSRNTPGGSNISKSQLNIPDKLNLTVRSNLPSPAPAMSFKIPSQARSHIFRTNLQDSTDSNLDPYVDAMFEAKKNPQQMETSVYNSQPQPQPQPNGMNYLTMPRRRQGTSNIPPFLDRSMVKPAVTIEKSVEEFPITIEKFEPAT